MYRSLVVMTLVLAFCACGRGTPAPNPAAVTPVVPAPAASTVGATEATTAMPAGLTNRTWLRTDPGSAPGSVQLFLDDGTLLTDSCFETYRLSHWHPEGERGLAWQEDGIDIAATIERVSAVELVLRLALRGGDEVQHFRDATVPYVCPDMPR